MSSKNKQIIDVLKKSECLESKRAMVGFDGVVDSIVKAIKKRTGNVNNEVFPDIGEFAKHLESKKGLSCSIELESVVTKIGGNMPILSNALGNLGIKVNCLGSMGYPEIHSVFKALSKNCSFYSVANPGYCTSIEFEDGKIMLAQMDPTFDVNWENLKSIIGLPTLINFFQKSDVIAMLNWSELVNSSAIWGNIIKEILPECTPNKRQLMFFDLSDCSRHGKPELNAAVDMIKVFSEYYSVVLSLNENEARLLYAAILVAEEPFDLKDIGEALFNRLQIDILVIHPVAFSLAWNKVGVYRVEGNFIAEPKLSTGGGDNFNAGFCAAQLLGLDLTSSLVVANAMSGFYVKNGYSAEIEGLIEFLKQ